MLESGNRTVIIICKYFRGFIPEYTTVADDFVQLCSIWKKTGK
jgi:hypothetical protein